MFSSLTLWRKYIDVQVNVWCLDNFMSASGKLHFHILYILQCTLIRVLESLEKQLRSIKNIVFIPWSINGTVEERNYIIKWELKTTEDANSSLPYCCKGGRGCFVNWLHLCCPGILCHDKIWNINMCCILFTGQWLFFQLVELRNSWYS